MVFDVNHLGHILDCVTVSLAIIKPLDLTSLGTVILNSNAGILVLRSWTFDDIKVELVFVTGSTYAPFVVGPKTVGSNLLFSYHLHSTTVFII